MRQYLLEIWQDDKFGVVAAICGLIIITILAIYDLSQPIQFQIGAKVEVQSK